MIHSRSFTHPHWHSSRHARPHLLNALIALVTVATILPAPLAARQDSATLVGTIVDSSSTPLAGVSVSLTGTSHAVVTGADGRFTLNGITAGDHTLLVRTIGYQPRTFRFAIAENRFRTLDVGNIALEPQTIELEDIVVREEGGYGMVEGFYRRAARGFGTYVTRADIERRNPVRSTDLLRTIPGVEIQCNRGDCAVSFARLTRPSGPTVAGGMAVTMQMAGLGDQGSRIGTTRDDFTAPSSGDGAIAAGDLCPISYYLDGMPYRGSINDFPPEIIEGIEIYQGPASTPPTFAKDGASCGAIVVWTRRR